MPKLKGWWKNRTTAGKVELYTRWSFHFFVVMELLGIGLAPLAGVAEVTSPLLPVSLSLMACTHAVLCGVHSSRALHWVVGRRERPTRLAAALALASGTATLGVLALRATGRLDPAVAPSLVSGLTCFATGSLVLSLRSVKLIWCVAPAVAAGTAVAVLALGLAPGEALGYAVAVLLGNLLFSTTCGFSAWLLKTVYELDRSREIQARLAVAEERLRFGRDLHDVMGRNLAVIALKSELAVQLARRERPEAVDQMIEVQRIAQESQREVRDVVRGYREADLAVELEGARGVLRAAGMDCRVDFEAAGHELPPEVQSALGWVVREATTNVLRHGDAHSCVIRLTAPQAGPVTLVVENDGAPETPAGPPGSGLAGLRERLAVVDGTLQAGPAAGGRFRLCAEIPGGHVQRLEVRA
ncbi:histidine kinase [Streptomyces sp. NBC_00190]|uniref:sensor histidine kinase n=1 Tax=unclassified Streptomyces TaxID=2593676 RepID=UPI002E2A4FD9|nr:histidine kinase [Streptomyces sp. NBC_00190]WSZ41138.1 histidine kinase [Streptomyces sp. NBC_00868]